MERRWRAILLRIGQMRASARGIRTRLIQVWHSPDAAGRTLGTVEHPPFRMGQSKINLRPRETVKRQGAILMRLVCPVA